MRKNMAARSVEGNRYANWNQARCSHGVAYNAVDNVTMSNDGCLKIKLLLSLFPLWQILKIIDWQTWFSITISIFINR